MSEKRFSVDNDGIYDTQEKKHFKFIAYDWIDCDIYECCEKLNEQQEQISYWKHKVNSLLWILSQFDEEKVKELLKELDDE